MIAFPRLLRFSLAALLPALALTGIHAQTAPAGSPIATEAATNDVPPEIPGVDHSAWLYKGSDITPDPDWHFGTLPNGLRYAVEKNGVPPGQVSVRLRIDAGSLNETDSERGFAHLIEHLTFRGSEYVADGDAKRIWQRMGTSFGTDTNAQTTPVSTVYRLDLPGATVGKLDESLKILSGMAAKPVISETSLNEERPVVLSEQREQPGAQVRYGDAINALMFAGQPLADRSPIGNIKTLEAATPAMVQAFHDRWYRPDDTVVVVAGDMDPDILARLVEKNFASWQGKGPKPEPDFGTPDPKQPTTAVFVEPSLPTSLLLATIRPWHFNNDTVIFNQNRMVDTIATQVISRRLETRARAGGSFLLASVDLDDVSRSANVTTVRIVPAGDNWEAALKDVRAVIADAEAHPPTQAEIDEEVASSDTGLRSAVETAAVRAASGDADDMVSALDIRETTTGPATAYSIFQDAKKKGFFTPARVLASTKRIFEGTATRALLNIPAPDPTAQAKLEAALHADISKLTEKRTAQAAVTFADLPKFGAPGKIATREAIADLDLQKITFANGVRLLLDANSNEAGRVFIKVRFGRGYEALPADKPSAAWAAPLALVAGGIGKLHQGDMDAMTAGRRIQMDFDIDGDAFTFSAFTSPNDYQDQLKLMAAKLAFPAWDPAPIARAKAFTLASYPGSSASPDGVISRDMDGLLHDGDPRWMTPTPDQIKALTPEAFKALWQPLLASGPIEVDVFGDVKADDAIAAVAATFGAMKPRAAPTITAAPIRFPAHDAVPVVLSHDGPDNQAAAVVAWPTGSGLDDIVDSRNLDVLAQIFTDRLFEQLRQGTGISYSPNVQSQWPNEGNGGGRLVAAGQVPPDKVDTFISLTRQIAADLVAHPVSDDELARLLGPFKQSVMRSATGNQFWLAQLTGAAFDPRLLDTTRNLGRDLAGINAASLQATAAKYLVPGKDWTMVVLPKDDAAKYKAGEAGK
jgi:zinc protease